MSTNYVLIDFENVQPSSLEILQHHPFKVLVFVGATQTKIPFDIAAAMQALGESAQYVKISGSGKNALDFHIAYYIGELAAKEPGALFHIISRDAGFDPLIRHLKTKKIKVQRESDLGEIPVLRLSTTTSNDEKISAIVKNLAGRGQSRPRKVKTLSNTINSLFTENLSEQQLRVLVNELEQRKYIQVNNNNVSYHLPS
ncbi:PIN domain-containing protein [Pelobacter seleniigenes]|uniref:PIN domain-containing protein n=1 Tax=Pelobacter seleniigenes TaxID=407188 RepID=UPI0004A6FDD5|nr:PIN domain-containing protein [Pelobacter seleniigenes]